MFAKISIYFKKLRKNPKMIYARVSHLSSVYSSVQSHEAVSPAPSSQVPPFWQNGACCTQIRAEIKSDKIIKLRETDPNMLHPPLVSIHAHQNQYFFRYRFPGSIYVKWHLLFTNQAWNKPKTLIWLVLFILI